MLPSLNDGMQWVKNDRIPSLRRLKGDMATSGPQTLPHIGRVSSISLLGADAERC